MICPPCAVGLYEECENPQPAPGTGGWVIPCGMLYLEAPAPERGRGGNAFRDPSELTDELSTGRKRAAALHPITTGMLCEWAGLKFAGGGAIPILGCKGNTIAKVKSTEEAKQLGVDEVGHLHHGPDKNVVNNTPGGNLHRICTRCHNRWHAINDEAYAGARPHASVPYTPIVPYYGHDAMSAFTDEEFERAEAWWATAKPKRPAYPFKPEGVRILLPVSEPSGSVATANPFESDGDYS